MSAQDRAAFLCWSVCPHLHALNDAAYVNGNRDFSRSVTYSAECYLINEGGKCRHRGQCLKAVFSKPWRKGNVG